METRTIDGELELEALAEFAAPLQQQPETHVLYLGVESAGVLAELAETTWSEVSAVAVHGNAIIGWLIGDVDPDMGRVWWLGPFIADTAGADQWHTEIMQMPVQPRLVEFACMAAGPVINGDQTVDAGRQPLLRPTPIGRVVINQTAGRMHPVHHPTRLAQ